MITNALTIDYEDWYQGLTSTSVRPDLWPGFERRIERATEWLLAALARRKVKATFFMVGEVAREHVDLAAEIARAGHEIGLHSDMHRRVDGLSRLEFAADLRANIAAVEDATGCTPVAFRAPCFSISSEQTPWFWEELAAAGVTLDSSVYPIRSLLYGEPGRPRRPYVIDTRHGPVTEVPISTMRALAANWPFSGGFYFRALPYEIVVRATRRMNDRGESAVFYFHPWEFDPAHPGGPTVTLREKLSHYGFLDGLQAKFERLLEDFRFGPLGTVFFSPGAAMPTGRAATQP